MHDTSIPAEKKNLRLTLQILIVLFATVWPSTKPVFGDLSGSIGPVSHYLFRHDQFDIHTSIKLDIDVYIDNYLFLMNSFQNKYRIVRFAVNNESNQPIKLDPTMDEIYLVSSDYILRVRGILNLLEMDPNAWDSLDEHTRKKLAYPSQFGVTEGEVEYIYAFFPADKVQNMPARFEYKIHSLQGKVLNISPPPKTAK